MKVIFSNSEGHSVAEQHAIRTLAIPNHSHHFFLHNLSCLVFHITPSFHSLLPQFFNHLVL